MLSLLLLIACGDKVSDTAAIEDTSATTVSVSSFQGMDFVLHSAEGFELVGDSMHLNFPADTQEMGFSAGCNHYSGEYTVEEGVFAMSGMAGTEMGCDSTLMDQDAWLASFFSSSPTVLHEGDILTFTGADATLVFIDEEIAVPDLVLVDITWEIDTYLDGETASAYNITVLPNVLFGANNTFTTNMGCNGASGSYTEENGVLSLTFEMITESICTGDENTIESHIFNVLNNQPTYSIDGNRLTLMAGEKGISALASLE